MNMKKATPTSEVGPQLSVYLKDMGLQLDPFCHEQAQWGSQRARSGSAVAQGLTRAGIKSSRPGKVGGLPEKLGLNLKETL